MNIGELRTTIDRAAEAQELLEYLVSAIGIYELRNTLRDWPELMRRLELFVQFDDSP